MTSMHTFSVVNRGFQFSVVNRGFSRIGGVMTSMHTFSAVNRGFQSYRWCND